MGLHPLHNLILDGQEGKALELYQALSTPDAPDDRWAGCALLALNQPLKAKDLLIRAVARGCLAARTELAAAYRILGEHQHAHSEIEAAILDIPIEFIANHTEANLNRALLLHELAIQQQALGDQEGALETLEIAWVATLSYYELSRLRCGIAQVQAHIYMNQRRYARAEYHFTTALESNGVPARAARVLLNRAYCHLYQSDYTSAQHDLDLVRQKLGFVPSLAANLEYVVGVVNRALGHWSLAIAAFELASSIARKNEDLDVAFHAELCLAACQTTLERFENAEMHLARAKKIKNLSVRDTAFLEWRSGQVLSPTNPKQALEHLARAKTAFVQLHMPRELIGVFLHLCNAYLYLADSESALDALQAAAHIAFESEDGTALLELSGLPRVQQLLKSDAPAPWRKALMPNTSLVVPKVIQSIQLVTLGAVELKVDGNGLYLRMNRTVEIMAYLLKNPNIGIEKILVTLFADIDPRKASNYFHKARQMLKVATSAIWIDFDSHKKTYAVKTHANLYWDAQAIQQILSTAEDNKIISAISAYAGEFLPTASCEWAIEEREALAWSIIKVGLETLQRWYESGEHQKCLSLAHRLLEIDPFNTAIHEFIINTTLSLEGELAAKRELLRASRRFVENFGEVPIEFDRLRNMLLN